MLSRRVPLPGCGDPSNFHRRGFRSAKKLANQKNENQPDLGTEKGSQTELDNQTALDGTPEQGKHTT